MTEIRRVGVEELPAVAVFTGMQLPDEDIQARLRCGSRTERWARSKTVRSWRPQQPSHSPSLCLAAAGSQPQASHG